ncbi:hypothetical protein ACFVT5_40865 [Streptomyces sp. NPDC058001]|uniref:DUF6197 family protein n=1 Tax=Streptomyces sp. NPDC058001 TaxID=3346300 RepID=UPI0036EF9A61
MTDSLKIAEILDRAADHIESVGWFQGELYDRYTDPSRPLAACRVCALGAINVALHGSPQFPVGRTLGGVDAHEVAEYVERGFENTELASWNDESGRTQDDVTAAFRGTAAELRGGAV